MKRIAEITENGRVVGLVHGADASDQEIVVNGRVWRFDYDEHCGPLWLRKDGAERKCQNPNKAVWREFDAWYERWERENGKAPTAQGSATREDGR